ncbi:hypothetical protein L1D14_20500 [Vibrio tubiashii]|uniref:hypothetical protein n=1 Tax=Vibrio tubiashii TaxID=29498 RepID=UPI001EFE7A1F|nr:hypothetical protein [Vibrio tubiashii]MCG9578602.1 hypothetical protein [Vibrio tubiashii]
MKKVISSLFICLSMVLTQQATAMEEKWSLKMDEVCNQYTLSLPLPALDMSCDLDTKSGNPSKWFNPYETCELSFDMIGLPSMGDIMGGIAGRVCEEVKKVKDKTVDDLIDQVNEKIPDNITKDINFGKDLNKELNKANTGSNWRDSVNANPEYNQSTKTCYTNDFEGNTITVPCDIASNANNKNQCYFKSTNVTNPFNPVNCDRYTVNQETCIVRWEEGLYGQKEPVIGNCTSALRAQSAEACKENGVVNYCTKMETKVTQNQRLCRVRSTDGNSSYEPCINIERQCFGHLNGNFQAASCKAFHDQYVAQGGDPFSGYNW